MKLSSIIILQYRPANQVEVEKKLIARLLEEWDGKEDFVNYLKVTLPVLWKLYARIN